MKATIFQSQVSGTITAPPSKSYMQRACAAALMFNGLTHIQHPGNSADDLAAVQIIRALGAAVARTDDGDLRVQSTGIRPVINLINCGESGLSARMFTPLAAVSETEITINGSGSILKRPMDFFEDVLPQLGVKISSANGHLPLTVRGALVPKNISIEGSLSSQYLTGLLMAFACSAKDHVHITVSHLTSRPYIDMTIEVLNHFGYKVSHENYALFTISPADPEGVKDYLIEGDWSGAAFMLVAGAINGRVKIEGLNPTSLQADRAILDVLQKVGSKVTVIHNRVTVTKGDLAAFDFDASQCPDLFPPLVALAAYCNGTSNIRGAQRLIHKESNRAETLRSEFLKMGVNISGEDDVMTIQGTGNLSGADIHSHGDHRIAMACAIAALAAKGDTTIQNADAVKKSYSSFFSHLGALAARVIIQKG